MKCWPTRRGQLSSLGEPRTSRDFNRLLAGLENACTARNTTAPRLATQHSGSLQRAGASSSPSDQHPVLGIWSWCLESHAHIYSKTTSFLCSVWALADEVRLVGDEY